MESGRQLPDARKLDEWTDKRQNYATSKKMHKRAKAHVGTNSFQVCSFDDYFFKQHRHFTECQSEEPTNELVQKQGDYAEAVWMKSFFDGTIDMSRQTSRDGCVVLNIQDAQTLLKSKTPLRDPITLVKRNNEYELKDGFHRLYEARARNYKKRIWTIVLDMDDETE